jgi:hypothetical protein
LQYSNGISGQPLMPRLRIWKHGGGMGYKSCLTGVDLPMRTAITQMEMNQRKYPRVATCNLISYLSIMEDGKITGQSMGRALNISQGGIYFETPRSILTEQVSLMSVDLDNNLIEIKGRIVYSKQNDSGMIGYGIRFEGTHGESVQFAIKLIKAFHYRKHRGSPAVQYTDNTEMRLAAG